MNLSLLFSAVLVAAALGSHSACAESLSYNGSLHDSGKVAEGSYDFQLVLYADAAGTKALSAPIVLRRVPVSDGVFSTSLDFGFSHEAMDKAYLGEQIRRSEGSAGFSKPSSDANVLLLLYAHSDLTFDGNAVLSDFNSVIDATVACSLHDSNDNCTHSTCKADEVSDCSNFFQVCMDKGGTFDGTSSSATCDLTAD